MVLLYGRIGARTDTATKLADFPTLYLFYTTNLCDLGGVRDRHLKVLHQLSSIATSMSVRPIPQHSNTSR